MSFKIVATRSRRGTEISLCPSAWEQAGILAWPPKNVTRLQAIGSSEPEETWAKFDCVVKKTNIPSYKEALYWEKQIQNVDTEEEAELILPAKRKYKRQPLKEVDVSNNLLDNLFEGINDAAVDVVQSYDHNDIMENENVPTNPVTAPNPSVLLDIPIFQCDDNLQIDISSRLDLIQTKIGTLNEEIQVLKQTFLDYRVQQNVTNAKIITMLDKISKDVNESQHQRQELRECSNLPKEDLISKYILPITDIEELKKMNNDLNTNLEFFKAMELHFNRFIGTDGQGRGEVLGKQMAEQIMTRSLMTEMSWTGVSRTEGLEKKFAFQSLETLLKLFYKVLLQADSRWSNQKNERLFTGSLLKHAKKRAIAEKIKLENKKTSRKHDQAKRAGSKGPPGATNTGSDGSPEHTLAEVVPDPPAEVPPESLSEVSPEPPAELPGSLTKSSADNSPRQQNLNENGDLLIKF